MTPELLHTLANGFLEAFFWSLPISYAIGLWYANRSPRRLKATFCVESMSKLEREHGFLVKTDLVDILAEEIRREVDQEILYSLKKAA